MADLAARALAELLAESRRVVLVVGAERLVDAAPEQTAEPVETDEMQEIGGALAPLAARHAGNFEREVRVGLRLLTTTYATPLLTTHPHEVGALHRSFNDSE